MLEEVLEVPGLVPQPNLHHILLRAVAYHEVALGDFQTRHGGRGPPGPVLRGEQLPPLIKEVLQVRVRQGRRFAQRPIGIDEVR